MLAITGESRGIGGNDVFKRSFAPDESIWKLLSRMSCTDLSLSSSKSTEERKHEIMSQSFWEYEFVLEVPV